jgi:hypothetical protein
MLKQINNSRKQRIIKEASAAKEGTFFGRFLG